MHRRHQSLRVLVVPTGGLMDDGITSWMKNIFSVMNRSDLIVETIAWPETNTQIIDQMKRLQFNVRVLPSRKKNLLLYGAKLLDLLKEQHYDIIHVCGSSGLTTLELTVAKIAGVPMRICHSHNTTCQHRFLDRITRPFMFFSATDFLACGEDAGKWLFNNRCFTVIPNGKNISAYRFDSAIRYNIRASLNLSDTQIAIGHVGRFNKQKNHIQLLEVFAELLRRSDKYVLFLIGGGNFMSSIRKKADELGISKAVRFLGVRNDVPKLLSAMDCMVLPSLYEGFPNVVVEWQINGLPCVLSDSITRECAVTPLVSFVSLSESVSNWADMIEISLANSQREHDSLSAVCSMTQAGYDITKNAETLREYYIRGVL